MPRFLTTVFLILLAPVLVAFFVANRSLVTISFDPTSLEEPALAFTAPLWAGLSGTLLVGFVLGAVGMWISNTRLRKNAKEQRRRVRELEREVKLANERPATSEGGTNLPAVR
ncbi:DUF1049 domain-containing protein [Parvularcula sp. ZS-1/3]|uniref:DUF1049 domain-containing protein n=1 Tax=Parvularcula mediterranea TaxID=2732508 RepID=A0A7Y3RKP2_9PROT|nr:lipopolysaccharide assembly protein LapA domain-containing protein [Parvularcula mediterranea]NNU15838.1 DUF1049 domain-containing protein [Parvularcula mediterranea]